MYRGTYEKFEPHATSFTGEHVVPDSRPTQSLIEELRMKNQSQFDIPKVVPAPQVHPTGGNTGPMPYNKRINMSTMTPREPPKPRTKAISRTTPTPKTKTLKKRT